MAARQQFNVNLDPLLVRRVKHHAIDAQLSLSELVTRVLAHHLDTTDTNDTADAQEPLVNTSVLQLQPLVHVEEMAPSVAFYEALGATVLHGSRDGDFVLLRVGEASLGLLAHPPNPEQSEGTVALSFASPEPLETLEARLRDAGVAIAVPTTDEGFGRQLQLTSPDGLLIKINELEPELYT